MAATWNIDMVELQICVSQVALGIYQHLNQYIEDRMDSYTQANIFCADKIRALMQTLLLFFQFKYSGNLDACLCKEREETGVVGGDSFSKAVAAKWSCVVGTSRLGSGGSGRAIR